MKVAILADIHANWVALERVAADVAAWQPDRVVVAGDVVNRGPRRRECLDFVQEKQHSAGWQVVRGNHEDYVLEHAGSVGFPFDGDHRAGYARLAWQNGRWQAEIVRLEYDVDRARRDFFESGYMAGSGALASLVLLEFDQARPNLHLWSRAYEAPVLAGEIDIVESVSQFLAQFNKEGEKG